MLIQIISPTLALAVDFIRQKLKISKNGIYLLISVLVIPPMLIWLIGYNFSDGWVEKLAYMIIVLSVFLGLYTLIDNRFKLKAVITVISTLSIFGISLLGSMGSSWAGSREVINETTFENYKITMLGPQLYEDEKIIRLKKMQLFGFIEKTVFERTILDTSITKECNYSFGDNKIQFVYDLCNNKLSSN